MQQVIFKLYFNKMSGTHIAILVLISIIFILQLIFLSLLIFWWTRPSELPVHNLNPGAIHYSETHKAEALACSCIDYRFIDETANQLRNMFDHQYDMVSIAGSSLFINGHGQPSFRQTFLQNVQIAIELHHIHTLVVIDHMDCGAYREVYGELAPAEERILHIQNLKQLQNTMKELYPSLSYSGYLMELDGTITLITNIL